MSPAKGLVEGPALPEVLGAYPRPWKGPEPEQKNPNHSVDLEELACTSVRMEG